MGRVFDIEPGWPPGVDQVTDPAGSDVLGAVRTRHGDMVGAFAADLLTVDGHPFNTSADA